MDLFSTLRQHAKTQPLAIASISSRRTVTYRKLWSRIERATARMKDEWQVEPGDVVVYWGRGHQDALMFYLAAARCGARLLALEHDAMQRRGEEILRCLPASLLLHDDDIVFAQAPAVPRIVNLSALIATRCHHTPQIVEDDRQNSLLTVKNIVTARADIDTPLHYHEQSLQALSSTAQSFVGVDGAKEFAIDAALFDADILAPHVLPVLMTGGILRFR
jgi:acyl-CoA synthetase (AMP-forming)/AMP-acid ligase II